MKIAKKALILTTIIGAANALHISHLDTAARKILEAAEGYYIIKKADLTVQDNLNGLEVPKGEDRQERTDNFKKEYYLFSKVDANFPILKYVQITDKGLDLDRTPVKDKHQALIKELLSLYSKNIKDPRAWKALNQLIELVKDGNTQQVKPWGKDVTLTYKFEQKEEALEFDQLEMDDVEMKESVIGNLKITGPAQYQNEGEWLAGIETVKDSTTLTNTTTNVTKGIKEVLQALDKQQPTIDNILAILV